MVSRERLASWRLAVFPSSRRQSQIPRERRDRLAQATQSDEQHPRNGLYLAISNSIVKLLRENRGRGSTKARTTIRDSVVVVMLEQTLTKGEQNLIRKGREDKVIEIRHEFQEAMRDECVVEIGELTGRGVIAFMSANHIEPDIGAEIFVLDGPPLPTLGGETSSETAQNGAPPVRAA